MNAANRWHGLVGGLILLAAVLAARPAHGQRLDVEAYAGRPFGVARVSLPPNMAAVEAVELNGFGLTERDGRAVYPVFVTGKIMKVLGGLFGVEGDSPAVHAMFLFRGTEPLRVTINAPQPIEVTITPRAAPPRAHERLLQRWWRDYYGVARNDEDDGAVPPLVHAYLTSMLGRRLNMEPPTTIIGAVRRNVNRTAPDEMQAALELLAGVERLRTETIRATMMRGEDFGDSTVVPVPGGIDWGPSVEPPFDPAVVVESLAKHVPHDCLYIRFGKYSNYLWFNQLLKDYSGDVSNMATQRALRTRKDERLQEQLALPPVNPGGSALADLLGEAAIADIALVGRDLYLEEGAAMGVMFQARTALLGSNFQQNRQVILKRETEAGATMETVQIAGRDVSFLATPDNRIRSFYAVDGDYHLVTTSRSVVEEFFAVADGMLPSLGSLAEFKHSRTQLPVRRDDTMFVFFSSGFLRGILEPQYQIETTRRMRSSTDLQLVQLARYAAKMELGRELEIEELVAAGFLPAGFGRRPDGSGPLEVKGRWIDSLRGAAGTMLPVADVKLTGVTASEAKKCADRAAYHQASWKQMDPFMVAVKRTALDTPGAERIVVEGYVSPLDETKYGRILSVIGPPVQERISSADGDVISVQAHLRGGLVNPQIPPHHLFLGIQDTTPTVDPRTPGFLQTLQLLQTTPGYIGAWPKPGFLDLLPFNLGGGRNPDPSGYSKLLLGWRRQWEDFSAVAFDRRLLEVVTPQLRAEPSDDPAQIRVHVADLSQTRLAAWVNGLYYQRAREISRGNVQLMHALSQQLAVPRKDARAAAQRLMNAELYCPLGGQYELVAAPGGLPAWRSTRWPIDDGERWPDDYVSPVLEWFRGIDSSLIKEETQLRVHANLVVQRRPPAEAPAPNKFKASVLDLLGGAKKPPAGELPPPKPPKPREF